MTTTIAILADVHGNLPALDAVLADIDTLRPDEVLVGGDLVGRGPQGSAVVRRIRDRGWPSVRGNHEDYLLGFRRGAIPDEWRESDQWAASRWMAAELGDDEARFIASLPDELGATTARGLHLVHGSPRSNNEGLGPWTRDDELNGHLDRVAGPLLVCAHTHRPMIRRRAGGAVVNVGSVGLPFNGDRRAQYALFRVAGESFREAAWEVELQQVDYDPGETLETYERSGFLAEGGITARLLALELRAARPFLVPFLSWAEARGIEPREEELAAFHREYDPEAPLGTFFRRLQRMADG